MKKIVLFILAMLLCTVLLVGCVETPPDEPPRKPTVDEQIKVGMSYYEVAEIIGDDGSESGILSNVRIWDTGEEKDLYVWFSRETHERAAAVTRFERRDDLAPTLGMTRDEVNSLFGATGKIYNAAFNIYSWKATDIKNLFAWFDADDKLVRYELAADRKLAVGMNQEQVMEFFLTEGTAVDDVYGLYYWPTALPDKFMYVQFDGRFVTNFFMDKDISVRLGDSYERLREIYGTEGTKVSRWQNIYLWQTSTDSFGLFKFEDEGGTLKLVQTVKNVDKIYAGMTFEQINESLGTIGEDFGLTTAKAYKWDTELEEDLYVWFDSELVATKFCYAKDEDVEVKVGTSFDDVKYIFDTPFDFRYRWITTEETDICIRFVGDFATGELFVDEIFRIPKLHVYEGMTMEYVVELMGKSAEWCYGSGVIRFVWTIGDSGVWLCVAFYGDGAYEISFRKENSVLLPLYPAPKYT